MYLGDNPAGNWLQIFLVDAVRRKLCTTIYCTACGAREFRQGVFASAPSDNYSSAEVAVAFALTRVRPVDDQDGFERAVRNIIFDLANAIGQRDLQKILEGTWAGGVLKSMQDHYRRITEAMRVEATRQALDRAQREPKRLRREANHKRRLADKIERDRNWHLAQMEGDVYWPRAPSGMRLQTCSVRAKEALSAVKAPRSLP